MNVALLLGFTAAGVAAAAAANSYYPDKSLTVPGFIPVIGGKTLEPGTLGAIGGVGLGLLTGNPALLALGAGAAMNEGRDYLQASFLPGPGSAPQLPADGSVAGLGLTPPLQWATVADQEILSAMLG